MWNFSCMNRNCIRIYNRRKERSPCSCSAIHFSFLMLKSSENFASTAPKENFERRRSGECESMWSWRFEVRESKEDENVIKSHVLSSVVEARKRSLMMSQNQCRCKNQIMLCVYLETISTNNYRHERFQRPPSELLTNRTPWISTPDSLMAYFRLLFIDKTRL
jgi:hypothetical protein